MKMATDVGVQGYGLEVGEKTDRSDAMSRVTDSQSSDSSEMRRVQNHARAPPIVNHNFANGEHVTIWNNLEQRKIAGNAAPLGKNLNKYLMKHPECEIYCGQDVQQGLRNNSNPRARTEASGLGIHVPIWNREEERKIAGNAAPLAKNLALYLARHPDCEVYNGQDKEEGFQAQKHARLQKHMQRQQPFIETPFIDPWLVDVRRHDSFEVEIEEITLAEANVDIDFSCFVQDDMNLEELDFESGMDFSPSGYLSLTSIPPPGCDMSVSVE